MDRQTTSQRTQDPAAHSDLASFAPPILINMVDRLQRLQDSLIELSEASGRLVHAGEGDAADVHLIRPRSFDEAGGFTNVGFRSNLDAHLQAARWARSEGLERVLVLEDDLSFGPLWAACGAELLGRLDGLDWQLASLGYLDAWREAPVSRRDDPPGWVRFTGRVNGAHAYFVHHSGYDRWIEHLEAVACGLPGDDLQGPMASDGAINTFSLVYPDIVRLLAVPNMVGTRPTRSDITPGPFDRLPVFGPAAEQLRVLRRRFGTKVTNFE